MIRLAYFITPHGFGHAARDSAIMDAVSKIVPSVSINIFATVPEWFFKDSLYILMRKQETPDVIFLICMSIIWRKNYL
jgi:hypothetical protein